MNGIQRIYGGKLVTPEGVIENGTITIENGVISEIKQTSTMDTYGEDDIDANGRWILPGIIDTHSDAIESEMQPRPTSQFPITLSFYELERKLISQGITTIYHSLGMFGERSKNTMRRNDVVQQLVNSIRQLSQERPLIHHRIHLRFEITNLHAVPYVKDMIANKEIDQISFMDHTPGQGQYRNMEFQKKFIMARQNMSEDEVKKHLEDLKKMPKVGVEELNSLAEMAKNYGIPLASHDDDSIEKLDFVEEWQARISEFPVDMEVALEAKKRGLYVLMGAPNVLLGRSHSNNLSALEAIKEGVVDILCSDYYPPSLLQSIFSLYYLGYAMNEVVKMVSLNPAKALGIAQETGSLEVGKVADILLVNQFEQRPVIEKVFINGSEIFQISYEQRKVLA